MSTALNLPFEISGSNTNRISLKMNVIDAEIKNKTPLLSLSKNQESSIEIENVSDIEVKNILISLDSKANECIDIIKSNNDFCHNGNIPPRESCTIHVKSKDKLCPEAVQVVIYGNNTNTVVTDITVFDTSFSLNTNNLTLSIGEPPQNIIMTNTSQGTISKINIIPSLHDCAEITENSCENGNLAPKETCNIALKGLNSCDSAVKARVAISTNAIPQPQDVHIIVSTPTLTATPDQISFVKWDGEKWTQTLEIKNNNKYHSFTITEVEVESSRGGEIGTNNCQTQTLSPGQSCTIEIKPRMGCSQRECRSELIIKTENIDSTLNVPVSTSCRYC